MAWGMASELIANLRGCPDMLGVLVVPVLWTLLGNHMVKLACRLVLPGEGVAEDLQFLEACLASNENRNFIKFCISKML
jgi:hypothetical protein